MGESISGKTANGNLTEESQKMKVLTLFTEESAKCEDWKRKYIASSMFVIGSGAFGSVFQTTTRLYRSKQQKLVSKNALMYHPSFLCNIASQRKLKPDAQFKKLLDANRDSSLLDIIAIKYEVLQQAHLEEGATRFFLFLRREFLILDLIWHKNHRILHGFPMAFDFGYLGDKGQFGVSPKYRNIFTYLNVEGEEAKFFTDVHNRNLQGVTKISFMSMELLGPSIDDFRSYFEPWYSEWGMRTFFGARTAFKIADQVLCRLLVLHKSGFVHHDIKPDNIAMGNGRAINTVYLLDFGFAKQLSSSAKPPEWMGSRKFISVDTYDGATPNYSQDIESWFYLTLTLLHDALPWTDEFLNLGDNADETARWNLVNQMKKSWWGESADATSLKSMINAIGSLHSAEVPDIKAILTQLHKKTRELRATMRSINDAQTLNFELANNQSAIFKGYMSIRKVLLQIFDLPNIKKNKWLGDAEFRSLQDNRAEKSLPLFQWDPRNYQWEWDKNHSFLCLKKSFEDETTFGLVEPSNRNSVPVTPRVGPRGSLSDLLTTGWSKRLRPDEVSYAFDRQRSLLLPKCNGRQHPNANLRPMPFLLNGSSEPDL